MTLCPWPICTVRLRPGERYCSRSHAAACAHLRSHPAPRAYWLSSVSQSRLVPDRWWSLADQLSDYPVSAPAR